MNSIASRRYNPPQKKQCPPLKKASQSPNQSPSVPSLHLHHLFPSHSLPPTLTHRPLLPPSPLGLPDPPVDVQVEAGPQDGSLLVTWLPVTINSTGGTSNGAPVTGYAVYADGKKVTEVESPTGKLS